MVELLRWMRRYNQTHDTRLEFHGFDMQVTEATAGAVLAYLREVDPPAVREAERALGPLATPVSTPHYLALSVEKQRAVASGIAQLQGVLERRRDEYVRRSGALDLREVPEQGPVSDWFAAARPAWEIEFSVSDAELREATQHLARGIVPGDAHEALIFAARTTAARRLPKLASTSRARAPAPLLQAPTNLGFEEGLESDVPRGWWTPAGANSDYQVELDHIAGTRVRRVPS